MDKLISVIVPVYNVEDYLTDCIESILNQSYSNLELILVNDGSKDASGTICDKYSARDKRVKVIHQSNKGVVSARGAGVNAAQGWYMAFVDGDDWIDSDMLSIMADEIDCADIISVGVYRYFDNEACVKRLDQYYPRLYESYEDISKLRSRMIYDIEKNELQPLTPWIWNKLYLTYKVREIYKKLDSRISFAEDSTFLYLYLLESNSVKIIDKCLYHYRYRSSSAIYKVDVDRLTDINNIYYNLYEAFATHREEKSLLVQLQKWITFLTCAAINESMGFDLSIRIPQFMIDRGVFKDKSFVIYGAGQVGQDLVWQLKKCDMDPVLWVDKNQELYSKRGFDVRKVQNIDSVKYDMIYIAIENKKIACEIKEELMLNGIPEEKIVWEKPIRIF